MKEIKVKVLEIYKSLGENKLGNVIVSGMSSASILATIASKHTITLFIGLALIVFVIISTSLIKGFDFDLRFLKATENQVLPLTLIISSIVLFSGILGTLIGSVL